MEGILRCEHVSKTFMPGNVQAVKEANLVFEPGAHIIMGKSGSGKSTLLHILGGLEKPTQGKVYYEGDEIYTEADMEKLRQRDFGFIFQAYNLIPEINVRDNILMPAYIAGEKRGGTLSRIGGSAGHRAQARTDARNAFRWRAAARCDRPGAYQFATDHFCG